MRSWFAVALMFSLGLMHNVRAQTTLHFAFDDGSPPYSYSSPGDPPLGLFPELVKAAFAALPEYAVKMNSYPWARAQDMVKDGRADGFLTYPSDHRKKYALFASVPMFIEDIGYLMFLPTNPNAMALRKAKGFRDLQPFLFLGSNSSEWESDNVPAFIQKESIPSDKARLNVLIYRKHGDFIIMGRENASYLLNNLGYSGKVEFAKVDFISESKVPFQLGIAKTRPDAGEIINKLNWVLATSKVKAELQRIQKQYQGMN
jgi:polar amino acid transport system substrate-binding protein